MDWRGKSIRYVWESSQRIYWYDGFQMWKRGQSICVGLLSNGNDAWIRRQILGVIRLSLWLDRWIIINWKEEPIVKCP